MKKKELLLEGIYAGATLAIFFWIVELFFCVVMGGPSFLIHRHSFSVDFGDILRSLPVYLLFSMGLGAVLGTVTPTASFVYAGLVTIGVGLFEWASWGDGALRVLGGAPWVRREIWTLMLCFVGVLWWRFLRRKTDEEMRRNSLAAFFILSLFLIAGQNLSVEFELKPSHGFGFRLQEGVRAPQIYWFLSGFALVSVYGFFLARKGIALFFMKRKRVRTILVFSLSVSLLGYLPGLLPTAFSQRPNIILVVLDTVRADHLAAYGYPKKTSPYLDQLAEEGVLFEEAKATSHWTLPSHASLFTGFLLSSGHGATSVTKPRQDCKTIAEYLRSQGYRTVGFSANAWVGEVTGLDRGFDQFVELWNYNRRSLASRIQARLGGLNPFSAPNINSLLRRWFMYDNRRSPEPFFLFINYIDTHLTYQFHRGVSEPFLTEPWSMKKVKSLPQDQALFFAGIVKYSERDFQLLSDLYDGEIAYVDHFLGDFVERLRHEGILDRTILVVTSDHGEYLGEHGLMNHVRGLYEEALHVPLLIRYPEKVPAQRIREPVQLTDVPPTLLELAAVEPLQGIEGQSLVPLLSGGGWSPRPLIAEQKRSIPWLKRLKREYPEADLSPYDYSAYSFQEGNYKVILFSNRPPELYDLSSDKKEALNLYHALQNHPIMNHLALFLEGRRKTEGVDSAQRLDQMRALRSLGYL